MKPWTVDRIELLVEGIAPDARDIEVAFRYDDEGPHLFVGLVSRITTADRMTTVLERVIKNTRVVVEVSAPAMRVR